MITGCISDNPDVMSALRLGSLVPTAYLAILDRDAFFYLFNDWDHRTFGPLSPERGQAKDALFYLLNDWDHEMFGSLSTERP